MREDGKIGNRQFMILVILFTMGTSIMIAPGTLTAEARQDAWVAAIFGTGLGVLYVLICHALAKRFPAQTLAEFTESILGKWPGKAVSLLYFVFFFLLTAFLLRDVGDFLTTQVLTQTPLEFIHILYLLVVVMGVRLGLEPIARAAEVFFPWIIGLLFILVVFTLPYIRMENLYPLLEEGFKPVLRAGLQFSSLQEYVVFLMVMPYIRNNFRSGRFWIQGVIYGGLPTILLTLFCILVMGPDITELYLYPSYELAKRIDIAEFLDRIQIMMATIWFMTIYFKTALCYNASVTTLSKLLNLKDYRLLTLPLALILLVLSIAIIPNTASFLAFIPKVWMSYAFTYMLLIPLLLLAVDTVRGISKAKRN
jgi:spore germination protein KB